MWQWNKKSAKQRKAITKRYMAGERRVARQVAARQRAQALSSLAADKKGLAEKQEKSKSGKDKPKSKPGGLIDKLAGAFDAIYRGGTILDTCSLRGGSCSYHNGFIGDPTTDAYKSGAGQDQRYNFQTGTALVPGGGGFILPRIERRSASQFRAEAK